MFAFVLLETFVLFMGQRFVYPLCYYPLAPDEYLCERPRKPRNTPGTSDLLRHASRTSAALLKFLDPVNGLILTFGPSVKQRSPSGFRRWLINSCTSRS